jgi:hypothetical protein
MGDPGRLDPRAIGDLGAADDIRRLDVAPVKGALEVPPILEEAGAASIQPAQHDTVLLMVGRVLGEALTTDNPAWRGNPVPTMRSLQRLLVAHSLTLREEERMPAMAAIRAVESAVRWRLRWTQMRRSDTESQFTAPQRNHDARTHDTENHDATQQNT